MEVYFKELISEDASLDKLVDDLERVVQGADNLAKSIGVNLAQPQSEIAYRLGRLKESCERIRRDIIERAEATDRLVRSKPYSFLTAAAFLGFAVGSRLGKK